jgi:hypothetical protein
MHASSPLLPAATTTVTPSLMASWIWVLMEATPGSVAVMTATAGLSWFFVTHWMALLSVFRSP